MQIQPNGPCYGASLTAGDGNDAVKVTLFLRDSLGSCTDSGARVDGTGAAGTRLSAGLILLPCYQIGFRWGRVSLCEPLCVTKGSLAAGGGGAGSWLALSQAGQAPWASGHVPETGATEDAHSGLK